MHVQALKLLIWMIIRTLFASYSLLGYLLGYLLVINKTQEINFLALTQALKAANVVVVRIKKLRRIKKKRWYMGQKSKCNVPNSAGDKKILELNSSLETKQQQPRGAWLSLVFHPWKWKPSHWFLIYDSSKVFFYSGQSKNNPKLWNKSKKIRRVGHFTHVNNSSMKCLRTVIQIDWRVNVLPTSEFNL